MKIYVGNLPWSIDDAKLKDLFAEFGAVDSASVITERDSGRSKGFGFVEFGNDEEGKKAVEAMNGKEMEGRELKVSEARPKEE